MPTPRNESGAEMNANLCCRLGQNAASRSSLVRSVRLLLALLGVLASVATAKAQTSATISGTVQDSSRSVIADAEVTLVNSTTQDKRSATTNAA